MTKPTRRILGFDLGTKCGWALNDDGRWTCDLIDLSLRKHESQGIRVIRFQDNLEQLIARPTWGLLVVYEKVYHHAAVTAAHVFGALEGALTAHCDRLGVPYEGFSPGAIKKTLTGKGNAKKDVMVTAAAELLGMPVSDHNIADAIAAVHHARQLHT